MDLYQDYYIDDNNYSMEMTDEMLNVENEGYMDLKSDNYLNSMSTDANFELMLAEMQNCLKDTADVRNIVQNISTDHPSAFSSIFKYDLKNDTTNKQNLDCKDEISRQKVNINCLYHDKQELINQVADLNNQLAKLKEDNMILRQELNTVKIKDTDWSKSSISVTGGTQRSTNVTEVQLRNMPANFLRSISLRESSTNPNGKSRSWSELRTHKIIQEDQCVSTDPLHRPNHKVPPRSRIFKRKDRRHSGGSDRNIQSAFYNRPCDPSFGNACTFDLTIDFSLWSTNQVCCFLDHIGLDAYVNDCNAWLLDGLHLIGSSKKTIEKELNITNKLHTKKLLIHVRRLTSMHVPAATYFSLSRPDLRIASNFNIRLWLDDIGLLHYLTVFTENNFDGYMLDQISLEDLQKLKITNELHCVSLKRGIQLLRTINYDSSRLIRRPVDKKETDVQGSVDVPCESPTNQVFLWTQHQVTEWLRFIELPEYASNIRGSGIHGALFIFEDRFNANTLAAVLNIQRSKTLLRRHLQVKFHELIGPSLVARKRTTSEKHDFAALSATSKIKFHRKKGLLSGIKLKKQLEQTEELLLPYSDNVENLFIANRAQ